jgi:hypothetical protein
MPKDLKYTFQTNWAKWMLMTSRRTSSPRKPINSFLFIRVTISPDRSYKEQISRRSSISMVVLGEVQRLGFNKIDVHVRMKRIFVLQK